ncbi:MAG: hypothetical protein NC299_09750 [Lachnospiraceae bacterium]|nr:hypothetical protein [Ruminococcus sp.]MCM1275637.1 hypothetical protein [Lachnospiraceae bacterium]
MLALVESFFDTFGLAEWYQYFIVNENNISFTLQDVLQASVPLGVVLGLVVFILNSVFTLVSDLFKRGRF